eukprot:TRINITY_DN3393_c0_g1_i3.p1 TRINITY_DN3393_c0_g1~~TRINITY_DN3393_c0_g1_i3.p1  ORF type:complete len:111 (-),score=31.81 TRINITY_DN3393_c0_g1_i3:83-415(-)
MKHHLDQDLFQLETSDVNQSVRRQEHPRWLSKQKTLRRCRDRENKIAMSGCHMSDGDIWRQNQETKVIKTIQHKKKKNRDARAHRRSEWARMANWITDSKNYLRFWQFDS